MRGSRLFRKFESNVGQDFGRRAGQGKWRWGVSVGHQTIASGVESGIAARDSARRKARQAEIEYLKRNRMSSARL